MEATFLLKRASLEGQTIPKIASLSQNYKKKSTKPRIIRFF
jgi:hypothetical protein